MAARLATGLGAAEATIPESGERGAGDNRVAEDAMFRIFVLPSPLFIYFSSVDEVTQDMG